MTFFNLHKTLTILLFLISWGIHAQKTELDYFREIHSEKDVRKYIEVCYTNINVNPYSLSDFDNIRSKNIGESFIDPTFGRKWTFIYEFGETIMNSERNAWNSDTSYFFLLKGTGTDYIKIALFNGKTAEFEKYITINKVPQTGSKLPSVRWMPGDPDKLFYLHSNKIYTYSISRDTTELFQVFASFTSTDSKIAGGDGNEVDPAGDFLIGNKGENCFVYNFFNKKVVRIQDNERFYFEPTEPFPTFSLAAIDYAIAFAGFIFELDEDSGGTIIRDYNGASKQKLYKRTPHMDPTFFKHEGKLYPGIDIRYNAADADYYTAQGLNSKVNQSYFHAFDPEDPSKLIRFTLDLWPSTTLGSGGQVSSNRFNGSTGILVSHGPALYDLPWEARYGECFERAFYDADATMARRIAHHYLGFEVKYPSSSYQPEGWQSPDGKFVLLKTYWGWYKIDLYTDRLSATEVIDYLSNPSPPTYKLSVENGTGTVECIENVYRTISANKPEMGQVFDKWIGDTELLENVNEAETHLHMPAKNLKVTATFKEAPKYNLNIKIDGSGSVITNPIGDSFYQGALVAIIAQPAEGFSFIKWRGAISSNQNPAILNMDSSITIEAVFSDGTYTGFKEMDSPNQIGFNIIVNPIQEPLVFNIDLPFEADIRITIYTLAGKEIGVSKFHKLPTGNSKIYYSSCIHDAGVYLAVLSAKTFVKTLKLIKE